MAEPRFQINDTDADEFCKKYGITEEEWDEIMDYVDGEGSTDNVYLELAEGGGGEGGEEEGGREGEGEGES